MSEDQNRDSFREYRISILNSIKQHDERIQKLEQKTQEMHTDIAVNKTKLMLIATIASVLVSIAVPLIKHFITSP